MTPILPLLMKHPRSEEVFIDTSAFYAVLDADDEVHAQARVGWLGLVCSNKLLMPPLCRAMLPTRIVAPAALHSLH